MDYYIERINKTIDYIDSHLANPFTLEELSCVAHFSKYHFNRIFTRVVGESPFHYILRLRLEKSASLIMYSSHRSLTDIASECGFSDLSIFSRNFKKHFNVSPSAFKKSNLSQIDRNLLQFKPAIDIYFCSMSKTNKWKSSMEVIKNVEIRTLDKMTVAYNRNFGPYVGNDVLYQQHRGELFAWAASKDLLRNDNFNYLIIYHDNPNVALNETQRMSLSVTIPSDVETEGVIGKMDVEKGKYLICECELSANDFSDVWDWIYGHWFPQNKFVPDDKPYFELYPEQPKGEIFKVNFCIPVKPL